MNDKAGPRKTSPFSTERKPASRVVRNALWVLIQVFLVYILEAMASSPLSSVRNADWTGFRVAVVGVVIYLGIRHAHHVVARKRRRAGLLKSRPASNPDPLAPLGLIEFPDTLGLRVGSSFEVRPGTFAAVVRGSNVLDILDPGAYRVDRQTFPLLAHDSTNVWGRESIEDAALIAVRDGTFEWCCAENVRGIREGGTCIESAPLALEAALTVTDRKAFVAYLLTAMAQRVDCDASSNSTGFRRQAFILTFENAIEAMAGGDSRILDRCFVDWVWMGIVPQDGTLAVTQDPETVGRRACEKLNEYLARAGCRCDHARVTPPVSFTVEPCQECGVATERMRAANFWACAGLLLDLWRIQRFGNFCQSCGSRVMKRFTLLTAILGWWGLVPFLFTLWTFWINATSLRLLQRGTPYRHRQQRGVGL